MTRTAGMLAVLAALTACTNHEQDSVIGGQGALPQSSGASAPKAAGAAPGDPNHKTVALHDARGAEVGTVELAQSGDVLVIKVQAHGLAPGFHGLHIHSVGKCEAPSAAPAGGAPGAFLSAGGHYQAPGHSAHPHSGDLTSVYALADGSATLTTSTDALTLAQLAEGQGASIIVHEKADNFGNIPSERYKSDQEGGTVPDEQTMNTGDAGGRFACGVIAPPKA